jgi:transposase-like protein
MVAAALVCPLCHSANTVQAQSYGEVDCLDCQKTFKLKAKEERKRGETKNES